MEFTQVASGYAHDNGISVRRVIDDIKSGVLDGYEDEGRWFVKISSDSTKAPAAIGRRKYNKEVGRNAPHKSTNMGIKELRVSKRKVELSIESIKEELAKKRTNHILHLLLTVVTFGFWVVVWVAVSHFDVRGRITLKAELREKQLQLLSIDEAIDNSV